MIWSKTRFHQGLLGGGMEDVDISVGDIYLLDE